MDWFEPVVSQMPSLLCQIGWRYMWDIKDEVTR